MNSTSTAASRAYSDDRNQTGPSNILERIRDFSPARDPLDRPDPLLEDEEWSEDEEMFINFSLLSNLAVLLRDKVPRGTHVKGSIPYPRAFTGRDIVSAIQGQIQRELVQNHAGSTNDRRAALQVARSLQSQLFFYEVEWGSRELQDGVEDVYMFLDDEEGASSAPEREELPTGVVTVLTSCYSPMCDEGIPCYSSRCPRKGYDSTLLPQVTTTSTSSGREEWVQTVPAHIIESLDEMEISRQTIIHKIISKEEQYIQDLDIVDTVFIKALRMENPPVLPRGELDEFIEEVFYNILDLRECNKRLLEVLYVRQREESPVIKRIGDIFLDVATEFRLAYPDYIGHHPIAEKRMRDELDNNPKFRLFIEKCSRKQSARPGERRLDLKHFLNRPVEHLQKYPVLLDAVISETTRKNPDREFLLEASTSISNLQNIAQLRTFQSAMGKGSTTWHSLVPSNELRSISSGEQTRQSVIFELIKGEMEYVKDLENIENMYIRPLREAEPPIVPRDRLPQFIYDVFHNYNDLYSYHLRLVEKFHEIQREEHPRIRSITAPIFDAALNFREAYMEYIPNYPIAEYRIDDEKAKNPVFRAFLDECNRHPDARRLDMKNFINRPIPRLLRYELLLKSILEQTHTTHEDSSSIPQVIEVIKALGKDTEPGVASAKQKVELWKYNSNLVFRTGETIDMDLLNEQRSLIHTGKLLRQPEGGLNSGWSELFVMLFDNYLVLTKAKEKDGVIKYHVTRRPIPLDLLSLVNFTDPSVQRGAGMLRNLRTGSERAADTVSIAASSRSAPVSSRNAEDSRSVYPFTIHHTGRLGGRCVLYAESATARQEWKQKLDEALGLRKVVQESNKVFEIETLSIDTFLIPSMSTAPNSPAWSDGTMFTGKVTCSVPFNTPDGRGLVAIGCAEGVWIGFRHDSRSMRRVLHLKMVTQCAILEDFGLFLVLADKALFAYHIEALVPTNPNSVNTPQTPQKLNGSKDVQFFSVGTFHGRTLLVYMRKRGTDSVFRVVEPVIDKINEKPKASGGLFPKFGRSSKAEWFRDYREFFLPCDAYDLVFLKAKIAILCTKGFEIMDMAELSTVTIPQRDDARLAYIAKRCETARPLSMFRHTDDEFLLCYDEFGIFVNKHGTPSRSFGTIEWEGTAERVALHAPYILLFDPRFIEVRHLDTGRLAQIIPGKDVRCIWDGRGVDSSLAVTPAEGSEENMVQEPRVHAVMSITEPVTQPNGRPLRGTAQHVFELVPTIPLYLPGSLASPTTGTYFPRTFSPPRSPSLRPTTSYRS
ncbi:CNH domain-containing protein [Crucibulum laeve]|uniref:CNH domain-containing protein n=1 Tax=Crucibulum laeve TaxID=68775 RepID=A0A5C3M5S6_9AGAR|nr:CNH domain-containing protein [Crucibulum laeve]